MQKSALRENDRKEVKMLKCVYQPCEEKVEYIYFGKSLCEYHFRKEVEDAVRLAKQAEETSKKDKRRAGAER